MTLRLERKDYVAIITLNRPEARNAISLKMLNDFHLLLDELSSDDSVRCLVLTGSENKSFSAGADLKERSGMSELDTINFLERIQALTLKLSNFIKPTICALNGDAYGGGLELALSADLRIAHEKVTLGLTEVSLGIMPGAGGTQRLSRLIGVSKAFDMIFLAKKINAEEALKNGIINYLTKEEKLMDVSLDIAEKISKNAPLGIKYAKKSILEGSELTLEKGLKIELENYKRLLFSKDRKEGIKSFMEKRPAQFIGK